MLRKNRRASLKSAVRPVLETLEARQLLSAATLTIVNPDALPGTSRIVFNTIQNPDTTYPNVTHNQQSVQITDTGTNPLVISSIALNGPWAFVGAPAGGYTNVTVTPSTPLTLTLQFTQSTVPAHAGNETNYTSNVNGGAAITGAMTINSNDATTPSKVVTLAGYWQVQSNNNTEPSLQTLVNLVYGYQTTIDATPYTPDLTETTTPTYYGNEVAANYWEAADPTQRVHLQEIAAWHTEGNPAQIDYYSESGLVLHKLFTTPGNEGQTLFSTAQNTGALAVSNFNPGGAFGINVDGEYSTDSVNVANKDAGGGGHHFRFFPLVDENGNAVPNTYIVAMDYGILQDENFDFQDNVFIMSNIRPIGTPATPTNLTATNGTAPVLSWTAVNYAPVAYNVYSSSSLNGTYTKLTTTPITTTTYTDTSAPIGTVYYRVTAVDTTQTPVAESAPAAVSASGGVALTPPVVQPYSGADYSGQAVTFNPLVGATDATGTINPGTVVVTVPNHGGTATAAASGLITYTPASGFSGTETFTYTVSDSNGLTATPATVTFADTAPVIGSPVVNNYFTTTLEGTAVAIPILSVDNPATTFNTSSVVITNPTTHGSTVINSDGSVTYTPNATFAGGDTFSYTVADNNGKTSATAVVDINVGAEISSAKGAVHKLVYTGSQGQPVTVTISKGIADIYFDGNGQIVAPTNKTKTYVNVNGNSMRIRDLVLSQTTVASSVTITSVNKIAVNLGAVTDASPLGTFNAKTTTISQATGTITSSGLLVGSLASNVGPTLTTATTTVTGTQEPTAGTLSLSARSIILAGATSATLDLGSTGVTSTALTIGGTVTDSNLTSTVPLSALRVVGWTNTQNEITTVTAPSIGVLSAGATGFQPTLVLTGTGTAKPTLTSASITGSLGSGYWSIGGNANSVVIGSTGAAWNGTFANLNSLTIRKGGLPADLTAGVIGTLNITGDLTGDINATSARSVRITGAITDTSLSFTGAVGKTAAIGTLTVGGAVTGSTITTAGNVNSITVGSLVNSSILLDTTATDVTNATASDIGAATLHSLTIKSKATSAFSDSNVIADAILSATTGQVSTTNGGAAEGLAAVTFKSLAIGADGAIVHLASKDLVNQAALTAYLTSKSYTFGDFKVEIVAPLA